jgi:hypothetical protein
MKRNRGYFSYLSSPLYKVHLSKIRRRKLKKDSNGSERRWVLQTACLSDCCKILVPSSTASRLFSLGLPRLVPILNYPRPPTMDHLWLEKHMSGTLETFSYSQSTAYEPRGSMTALSTQQKFDILASSLADGSYSTSYAPTSEDDDYEAPRHTSSSSSRPEASKSDKPKTRKCPHCGGRGQSACLCNAPKSCKKCGGTKKVTCSPCKGSGELKI